MQATLDAAALKPFTKALTCISRYGDELTLNATPECLSLSATNSSKSAYCRFKYESQFFQKYKIGSLDSLADDIEEVTQVTGQLLTKLLLSILKHRTVEKTVEKCELSIVEGGNTDDEAQDGLESRLIVCLHCRHGVIKTHRLLLSTPTSLMAPGIPDNSTESLLTIGPRAIRDMIEHFTSTKNGKSDPQLIWNFGQHEVEVKSLESSVDSKGKSQLSTELSISSEEFDVYNLYAAPTVIAFHLREFNATIAFTDSLSVTMDIRFTDPAAPLFIDVDGDSFTALFVISTSQVQGMPSSQSQQVLINRHKREHEEDNEDEKRFKKPMKAVRQSVPPASVSKSRNVTPAQSSIPQPSLAPPSSFPQAHPEDPAAELMPPPPSPQPREPLFFPSSSQITHNEAEDVSGLGLDQMTAEEVNMMLDGDADESMLDLETGERPIDLANDPGSSGMMEEPSFGPTQSYHLEESKAFQPLFDD
ncbi:Rad9-domain-containing protein [Desarmillaria tabescens]|uniref:Rad9-domain-containing protein n=1 Tax=Armillaria tabescens TaxID=1929756 RepID=A0AA39N958_ARMTA|nr:Rad9-domain-containing protein [Desarmillaria tabescens]KAK0461319.1 Rad9-domain-containing protein [Desarmillaria tabescens]